MPIVVGMNVMAHRTKRNIQFPDSKPVIFGCKAFRARHRKSRYDSLHFRLFAQKYLGFDREKYLAPGSKQGGDTLVEVLMAIVIVSVVIVGALTMMSRGLAVAQIALEHSQTR